MTDITGVDPAPHRLSSKWDIAVSNYGSDVIALSIADMELAAPPAVLQAVAERVADGAFGYTYLPPSYFEHVQRWMRTRHDWTIPTDSVVYTHRVVEAASALLQEFTEPGDGVLIHTPSYGPITNLIEPLGRRLVTSPLRLNDGRYEIDFEETDRLLGTQAKVLFLFSPHNPSGRVWTTAELTQLADIARRHNALIISDEVHADLVHPGHKHLPIAALDDQTAQRTITLTSAGKPFNLAGLEISNVITQNTEWLERIRHTLRLQGLSHPAFFANAALDAAYGQSEPWLESLLTHIGSNLNLLRDAVQADLPGVQMIEPEGTYLVWLDCREVSNRESDLIDWMRRARVALSLGTEFGAGYEGFLRINLAVPTEMLHEALTRLGAHISPRQDPS